MPKVSKATASSHVQIPGALESLSHETEGWTVSFDTYSIDVDGALNRQLAYMAPNVKKYLEEQGMEVPPQFQAPA